MKWIKGINDVVAYIEANLTNPVEREVLARIAGCSVSQFSRLFSHVADMSVSEYIRRRRLAKAVFDIQNSDEEITEIAFKYCYESPTAFTRAFKEVYGLSPAAARKSGMTFNYTPPLSFTIKSSLEELRMAEIVKCYAQKLSPCRFVGKKYGNGDRKNGGFGHLWDEWTANDLFKPLAALPQLENYEDAGSHVSYMRAKGDEPFEYYIGMLLPESTPAPEGYMHFDINAATLGVCWVKGTEPDIYMLGDECEERLEKEGYSVEYPGGAWISMERYVCPRNTQPDADGNIIVDICYFIE